MRHPAPGRRQSAEDHTGLSWPCRPPWDTLEPVTAPAGARAAHLSPPAPARDHLPPAPDPVSREPHAAQTHGLSWRFLGAGIVDEVPAGRGGGDERGDGGVVQGPGQAVGDAVQPGDRVIGEKRLLAAGQGQVMAQVGGGLGEVHRLDGEPGGDPLVQGGEHAHAQLPVQGGLPGQDAGERGRRVHLAVRQEPQFLQLGRVEEVGLIADHHDAAVPLGGLGGEQVRCLGHQLGFEVAGLGAERADDRHVQAPGPERGVGDVDHLVAGGVEGGDGGAQRHGLPCSHVPRHHSQRRFDDAEADPGDRLGVRLAGEQVPGGDGLAERGAGQAEVRGPRGRAHRPSSPSSSALSSWPGPAGASPPSRVKSILEPVPASSSWAAATRPR
jgi:hypothetical protein